MIFVAVAINLFQLLFLATRSTKESFLIGLNRILLCFNNSSQIAKRVCIYFILSYWEHQKQLHVNSFILTVKNWALRSILSLTKLVNKNGSVAIKKNKWYAHTGNRTSDNHNHYTF